MAIAFKASAAIAHVASGNLTDSTYTVNAASTLLVCAFAGGNVNSSENSYTVTWAGVTCTKATEYNAGTPTTVRYIYMYYLLNPTTGNQTLSITQSGSNGSPFIIPVLADYSGVLSFDAAGTPASATSNTTVSSSITTVANNCWVMVGVGSAAGAGLSSESPTISARQASDFNSILFFDTNAPITPAGLYNQSVTLASTTDLSMILASFSPTTAAAGGHNRSLLGVGTMIALPRFIAGAYGIKLLRDLRQNPIRSRRRLLG